MPTHEEDNLLSPADMKLWLRVEMTGVRLAAERRIQEAKGLMERYASGQLNQEEANRLLEEYEKKWGHGTQDADVGWQIWDEAAREVYGSHTATSKRRKSGGPSR
jgi:hypothetical protein